jgi:AraC-like DNA-binding protein
MARDRSIQEAVSFRRRREIAGIEVRSVENSAHDFRYYTPDFEFLISSGWRGDIVQSRRRALLEPGALVCLRPGDVCSGRMTEPGSRDSLHIEHEVLAALLLEHGVALENTRFRFYTRMSARLAAAIAKALAVIAPGPTPEEVRSALSEFVRVLLDEAFDDAPHPSAELSSARNSADRVKQCLENDPSMNVDLAAVARETGMSRFRALRVFKRWYGLPPHAYQLRVRVGLVQKSLRSGSRPAEAAAEYGFVDQSHLTRHFRRLLGVTPAAYARVGS